jgi:hypothetical protein
LATIKDIFAFFEHCFKPESIFFEAAAIKFSSSVRIVSQQWLFCLEWQSFTDGNELPQLMRSFKYRGCSHYIVNVHNDIVGFAKGHPDGSLDKKMLSAAIHLAETASFGGLELFVFEFTENFYGLIALNESRPVPQFDSVGTEVEIMGLVEEYRALHAKQSIRYVSNTDWFDNVEKMSINDAFSNSDRAARVQLIPNYQLRKLVFKIILPIVLIFMLAFLWIEYLDRVREQERLAREQEPDYIYEKTVASAMRQIGPPAQISLTQWREIIYRIPTVRFGWKLERITCHPASCNIIWQRDYGSYIDFQAKPLDGFISSTQEQIGDSPSKARLSNVLKISNHSEEVAALTRAGLPPLREALERVASKLQDLSLLPNMDTKLKSLELYPNTGAQLDQIINPVVKGEWTISHELWTLGDLSFDYSALDLQSLIIQQDEKTKKWIYTLTGNFYAKGK